MKAPSAVLISNPSSNALLQNGDVPGSWRSNVEGISRASSAFAAASAGDEASSVAGVEHVRHRVDAAER